MPGSHAEVPEAGREEPVSVQTHTCVGVTGDDDDMDTHKNKVRNSWGDRPPAEAGALCPHLGGKG